MRIDDGQFTNGVERTRPAALTDNPDSSWCMATPGKLYLVYAMNGATVRLDLSGDRGNYRLVWVGAAGEQDGGNVRGGSLIELKPPRSGEAFGAVLSPAPSSRGSRPGIR